MNSNLAFIFAISFAVGIIMLIPKRVSQSSQASPSGLFPVVAKGITDAQLRAQRLIQSSGVPALTLRGLICISLISAVLATLIVFAVTTIPTIAVFAGLIAALAPSFILRSRARRLVQQRRSLWPNICELLLASVRSGSSLGEAVCALAKSAPESLRADFQNFERDYLASGHFDSSVVRLRNALADATADRIIETLRVSRSLGGVDLPLVLAALAKSVRAQVNVREEVRARQSWVRGTAVLGLLAPWVIMTMLVLRPEGVSAYSSPSGVLVLSIGLIVSVSAYVLMIRLGTLPDEKRWSSFVGQGQDGTK